MMDTITAAEAKAAAEAATELQKERERLARENERLRAELQDVDRALDESTKCIAPTRGQRIRDTIEHNGLGADTAVFDAEKAEQSTRAQCVLWMGAASLAAEERDQLRATIAYAKGHLDAGRVDLARAALSSEDQPETNQRQEEPDEASMPKMPVGDGAHRRQRQQMPKMRIHRRPRDGRQGSGDNGEPLSEKSPEAPSSLGDSHRCKCGRLTSTLFDRCSECVNKVIRDAEPAGRQYLSCDHCGCEAIGSDDGKFGYGDGESCMSCGFPGCVSVRDESEDPTADWVPVEDEDARCNDAACDVCKPPPSRNCKGAAPRQRRNRHRALMASWPYSTQRWQRLRAAHLSTEPCCRYCDRLGRVTPATVVDHIVPVRKARDRAFDQTNLQSLCAPCHSGAKQREEAGGEPVGCGVDGVPLKGWE